MLKCPVCGGSSYLTPSLHCVNCYSRYGVVNHMIEEGKNSMREIYYTGAESVASCIKNGNYPGNAENNFDAAIEKAKAQIENGNRDIAIVVKVVAVVKKVNPVVVEKF